MSGSRDLPRPNARYAPEKTRLLKLTQLAFPYFTFSSSSFRALSESDGLICSPSIELPFQLLFPSRFRVDRPVHTIGCDSGRLWSQLADRGPKFISPRIVHTKEWGSLALVASMEGFCWPKSLGAICEGVVPGYSSGADVRWSPKRFLRASFMPIDRLKPQLVMSTRFQGQLSSSFSAGLSQRLPTPNH